MRKTRTCLALVMAAATLLVGCDSEQAQISEAQLKLDSALATFAVAQRGYAPAEGEPSQDLQAFRQEQLAKAVSDLEAVITGGSAEQKAIASKLLADVHLSAARYATRDAMAEYAALGARTPILDAALHAAERAAAQVQAADVDYDATLAQLAADSRDLQQQQTRLREQVEALQQQMADEQAKQRAFQSQSLAATAEARQVLDAAFVAEGDQKLALQEEADAANRRAGEAAAAAEKHQIAIDLLQRRLEVAQRQLETVTSQIADLKTQADQVRQLQTDTRTAVAAAEQLTLEQAAALKQEFDQLSQVYTQTVDPTFIAASQRAARAVQLLDSANAEGEVRLGARLDMAHVNTERAMAAASWAAVLDAVAVVSEKAGLPEASAYREAADTAAANYEQAAEAARAAIAEGRQIASSLGQNAAAQVALLDSYEGRLGAAASS